MTQNDKRDRWNDTIKPTPPVRESLFWYRGYPCAVLLMPFGHRCGYVGIPKGSMHYGKHYNDIPIDCHGGVTYSENYLISVSLTGDKDADAKLSGLWWIGFDCAHWLDMPDYSALYAAYQSRPDIIKCAEVIRPVEESIKADGETVCEVRTREFCETECRGIVDQLIALEEETTHDRP